MLHKMKVKNTNECDFCGCEDYIEHVFVHCQKIQPLWIEIEKQLSIILNKTVKLTICDKLIGFKRSDNGLSIKETHFINHAILIGKLTISKFRYGFRFNIKDMLYREANLRNLW